MIDKIFTSIPIATSNTSEHSGLPLRFSEVIIDLKKKMTKLDPMKHER